MIEYMYSRMIVTVSSIVLVAAVISSSIGVVGQVEQSFVEGVASEICDLVKAIGSVQSGSIQQNIVIDEGARHRDLSITFSDWSVTVVDGRYRCSMQFEIPVTLISGGITSESLVAVSNSTITISAEAGAFNEPSKVFVELQGENVDLT
jgi:hypothetical protein